MITWCVAYTQPLKELSVQKNLTDQGFEVYLPRFKKLRRHARKVEEVLVPLFPRYIFVGIDSETAPWRSINGTRGISCLLMADNLQPAHIPSAIIKDLKSRETGEGIVPVGGLAAFTKGDQLRILDGVFKDQTATFEAWNDKSRIDVLLGFLGRQARITMPANAVEAA